MTDINWRDPNTEEANQILTDSAINIIVELSIKRYILIRAYDTEIINNVRHYSNPGYKPVPITKWAIV